MSAYTTLTEANAYFDGRLYSSLWGSSLLSDREKALTQAAYIIDRLNLAGEKHAASVVRLALTGSSDFEISLTQEQHDEIIAAGLTQELEFPRGSDTVVPVDVKIASYEIAFALLDGVNPDAEFEDLGVVSQGYSSVRTTYDRTSVPEHTNSGVPSPTAWRRLKPYLRDSRGISILRV